MSRRGKLFTLSESLIEQLDRQVSGGYRSQFVERAIRDRLEDTTTPEQPRLKWLYNQILLHDEASIEAKCIARWYVFGNSPYTDKDGVTTVFGPMYYSEE